MGCLFPLEVDSSYQLHLWTNSKTPREPGAELGLGPQHQEGETIAGYYAREFRMTLSFAFSKEGQTDTLCLSDSSTQRALGHGVMGPS